ncbi:hypothetical protein VNO77_02610 [Canavalia gladiata]|uniref:Uncharacterized protein n=1 Tax=Canavalia gladiata TaxID=3824 RepID=A0AAN9RBF7_CANGL
MSASKGHVKICDGHKSSVKLVYEPQPCLRAITALAEEITAQMACGKDHTITSEWLYLHMGTWKAKLCSAWRGGDKHAIKLTIQEPFPSLRPYNGKQLFQPNSSLLYWSLLMRTVQVVMQKTM